MKLAIVIPAFNEEKVIGRVLKSLPKNIKGVDEIISIVVDDGSNDKTFLVAKKYATKAIKLAINMGAGAATITGLEAAKKMKTDVIVTMDADGQHSPDDIKKMIGLIIKDKADLVNGSRMLDTKGMPAFKIFGNLIMNFITLLVFHIWVTDSQSGMRAISTNALKKIKLSANGHEICSEMIGEAKRNNFRIVEVGIQTIYTDYSKKKGQDWLNGLNILTKLITIRLAGKK